MNPMKMMALGFALQSLVACGLSSRPSSVTGLSSLGSAQESDENRCEYPSNGGPYTKYESGVMWHANREVSIKNADDPNQTCLISQGETLSDGLPDFAPLIHDALQDANGIQFTYIPDHCGFTRRSYKGEAGPYYVLFTNFHADDFTYEDLWPAGCK